MTLMTPSIVDTCTVSGALLTPRLVMATQYWIMHLSPQRCVRCVCGVCVCGVCVGCVGVWVYVCVCVCVGGCIGVWVCTIVLVWVRLKVKALWYGL